MLTESKVCEEFNGNNYCKKKTRSKVFENESL